MTEVMEFPPLDSYVYMLGVCDGAYPVKVGYSTKPKERLSSIRHGFLPDNIDKDDLSLIYCTPGGLGLERVIHTELKKQRVPNTNEWFRLGPMKIALGLVVDITCRYNRRYDLDEPWHPENWVDRMEDKGYILPEKRVP